jgi:hypothetical protein
MVYSGIGGAILENYFLISYPLKPEDKIKSLTVVQVRLRAEEELTNPDDNLLSGSTVQIEQIINNKILARCVGLPGDHEKYGKRRIVLGTMLELEPTTTQNFILV